MADSYKLIYRGEVLEGQHAAVVKKRLGELLKLEGDRLAMLFTGKPVVLKKSVDETTAARFQSAFRKAGALLRVARNAAAAESETAAPPSGDSSEFELLPVGSDLLQEDEREHVPQREVDTSHIKLAGAVFSTPEAPSEVGGPDVSHLDIAEVGARLGPEANAPEQPVLDVNFDLADLGETLGPAETTAPPPLEIAVDFELAEPGARIGPIDEEPQQLPPDTSHIELQQPE